MFLKYKNRRIKIDNNLDISDSMYSRCENGAIKLGTGIYNGKEEDIYFYNIKEDCYYNMRGYCTPGMMMLGKMGAGKSVLLQKYIKDSINSPNGTVIIDTSSKSNFTTIFNDNKINIIDLSKPETAPAFSFEDFSVTDDSDIRDKIFSIYRKAFKVVDFIDTQENLSKKSRKYLYEMSVLVFANNKDATLNNIIEAINKNNKKILISSMPIEIFKEIKEKISLMDESKDKNYDYYKFLRLDILEKFQELKDSFYLSEILNKNHSNTDINIKDVIINKETLIIRIPRDIFNESETSSLINYYLNTLLDIKENIRLINKNTTIFIDNINEYPHSHYILKEFLVMGRILNTSLILTAPSFNQLTEELKGYLYLSSSSFLVLSEEEILYLEECLNIGIPNLEDITLERYTGLFVMVNREYNYNLFKIKLPKLDMLDISEPYLV